MRSIPCAGVAGLAVCLCLGGPATAESVPPDAATPPATGRDETHRTDLVERTARRLVQLDVTVRGPREAITDMTAADFELVIGSKPVEAIVVDDLCRLPGDADSGGLGIADDPDDPPQGGAAAPAPGRLRASYLFYLDMHHLTMAGRQNAIDLTRKLVEELIVDDNRGMVVSAGKTLHTFAELTGDRVTLLAALDRLEADRTQWDPSVMEQDRNISEILDLLDDNDVDRARSRAREYAREEAWRTERALRLFSMVLGRMADFDPPKAVVYFADTMRSNAGDHYLSFFGTGGLDSRKQEMAGVNTFAAHHAFEEVISEATAMGIRLYTIQAEGLVAKLGRSSSSSTQAGWASPTANQQPVRHAQNSLSGLALESGGQAFLNGVAGGRIAQSIRADLSCLYLISFDASALAEDRVHRVVLRSLRPDVEAQARGRVVVQSESRRLTSRLLSAFGGAASDDPTFPLWTKIVPLGFDDGKYRALVQASLPGSPIASTWDIGVSLVSRGAVREDARGRVVVGGPGLPVVFETEMDFAPGPFELVTVAHEATADAVSTARLEGSWPDPNDQAVSLGPIAVLQPTAGALLRGDAIRGSGSLGLAEGELGRTDRPTAIVGIVCRNKAKRGGVMVERRLVGDSSAEFEPQELDFEGERCAQLRDMIPAGAMTTGRFAYELRVLEKGREVASAVRHFDVASPDEHPALSADSDPR